MSDLALETEELLAEEGRLEALVSDLDTRLSGLKDIDLSLTLAGVKLRLCLALMKRTARKGPGTGFEEQAAAIGERAASAMRLVESLALQNVSLDQGDAVRESSSFAEVKSLLETFILQGGGAFLRTREIDDRKQRVLSRTVLTAIRRFLPEDDRYPPLEIERYPRFLQRLLLFLFPVMIRLRPQKPPYGIEEGHEVTYTSPAMRLPLSQAIHYMENELLPQLARRLKEQPGHAGLQEEERRAREQLERYKGLRVSPRAAPVLPLEKGLHTEGMTGFTRDGEILVSIPFAVSFRSGTNLDRTMELVRMDVVRRIAGRGVSAEIDREYRRLRSIESGPRGSSRTPSFKVDPAWGFWVLRRAFPFLSRLSDKKGFRELADTARSGSFGAAQRRIAALVQQDQGTQTGLPSLSR